MRREDDAIEIEDLHRRYARWRQDHSSRSENVPAKPALPHHRRVGWTRSRDTRAAHRNNPRPILTKEEWERLSEDMTCGLQEFPLANGADVDASKETHGR